MSLRSQNLYRPDLSLSNINHDISHNVWKKDFPVRFVSEFGAQNFIDSVLDL
jgi:hypothetical protein